MQGPNTNLAIVLEEVTDAFFILDGEWRFTYLNSETERVLARDGKELLGKDLRGNLPDTLGPPLHRELLKAAEEQTTVEFRQHHPTLDAWFEVRAYPLNSGFAVSFRQTDGRGPCEDSVSSEGWRALMQRALDASSAGALLTDATLPDNPIIYVNHALQRITGYYEEEMLGYNCRMFQSGDRGQPELDELREAVRCGEDWTGVLRNYRKDGTLFYNELYVSAVRDGDENITHYIGIQNDITARVEAEREQRESERSLRSVLTRYGSEMVTILEPDGTPRYESPAIREALGYSHMEESGNALYERLHPDDAWKIEGAVGEALATPGTHPPVEYRIRHADGSWRHFESVGSNLADDPEVEGVVVTTRNITDRRRAEQHRKARYEVERAISRSTSLDDAASGILAGLCDALGWEIGELWIPDAGTGDSGDGVLRRREYWYASASGFEEFIEGSRQTVFSHGEGLPGRVWQSGEPVWMPDVTLDPGFLRSTAAETARLGAALAFPILLGDEVPGVMSFFSYGVQPPDPEMMETVGSIGNHVGQFIERCRADRALQESERRNTAILEAVPDLMLRVSSDGEYLECRGSDDILYVPAERLLGSKVGDVLPAEVSGLLMGDIDHALHTNEEQVSEYRLQVPAGVRDFEARTLASGPDEVFTIIRDVTERKRTEETIRRQATAMESSSDGVGISGPDGVFTYLNQAHADLYGCDSPDELVGKSWRDLYSEESVAWFERNAVPILAEEGSWRGEAVGVRKDGSEFPQELSLTVLEDGGTVCVFQDITQRKRAERAVTRSESRLAEAQSVAEVGSWEWDLTDGSLIWSWEQYRIFGVDPERFEASLQALLELVHPEDRERVRAGLDSSPRDADVTESEYRIVRPDGEVRVIYSRQRTERDEDGEPARVLGTIQDVTERRRDEEARRILASIVENSEEAIVGNTIEGTVTSWNPAAERLFGYTAREVIGESVSILNPEEKPEENLEKIQDMARDGTSARQETVRVAKDGTRIEVSVTRSPIRDMAGNVTGTSAIFKDVSDRKEAERALTESESRFRNLVELSPDTIFVFSEGVLVYINPAGARLLGAERPEEILGKPMMDFVHPDYKPAAEERVSRLQTEGGQIGPVEEELLRLDGGSVEVEVAGLPITYEGRPAVQSLARDVTERKRAQEALRQSEERYRAVVEDQTEMICRFLPDRTLTFVNDAYCQYFGIERENLSGTSFMSLVPEEERYALDEHLFSLSPERPVETTEHRVTTAGGEVRWQQWTDRALFGEQGELVGFQAVGHDITGRKEAEEALQRERNLLRGVMDSTQDAIFSKDIEHRFRLSNTAHQRILGAESEDDLMGKTNADYWGQERAAPFYTDDRRVLDGGESIVDKEEKVHKASGEEMWISTTKVPLRASDGTVEGLVAVSRDTTGRRREQEALAESERLLRAVNRGAPLIIFATDLDGVITLSEGKGLELVGRSPGEEVGKSVFEAYAYLPEIVDNVRRALVGQEVTATVEAAGLAFESRYSPMRDSSGEITGSIGIATDITAKRELEKELEHRAFHDPLTDLPNRVLFMQRLENALAQASQREKQVAQVAVLFLDLDDFKHVNDSMGHSTGDRLLIGAGKRIKECLRDEGTVARLGGDEFAVLLEEIPSPDFPARVAQRIAGELRHPFSITSEAGESVTDREIVSTTSIGIALSESEDTLADAEKLLQQADSALYRAKETGKDHHELFRQEMKDRSVEVLRLGRELHRALERDEFTVHYQPTTSLETDRTIGLEALVRWEHPERGLVSPDEFIPLAEENGLIVPLGRRVLYEACQQAAEWQSLYPARSDEPPLKMNVNLSARQLQSPELFGDVAGALSESGLPPSSLVLEITESVLIGQDHHETSTLYRLKELGVNLAIDDFGSGYSSLSYLKDLPVDILKVDRSLISNIGRDAAKAAIVSAAIEVAHALGLPAVAEGVEKLDELEELRRLGCDIGQGYYWSRPLPAAEITSFL